MEGSPTMKGKADEAATGGVPGRTGGGREGVGRSGERGLAGGWEGS
jgi:hypothetical protein